MDPASRTRRGVSRSRRGRRRRRQHPLGSVVGNRRFVEAVAGGGLRSRQLPLRHRTRQAGDGTVGPRTGPQRLARVGVDDGNHRSGRSGVVRGRGGGRDSRPGGCGDSDSNFATPWPESPSRSWPPVIHEIIGFGLQTPLNRYLLATWIGMMWGLAGRVRDPHGEPGVHDAPRGEPGMNATSLQPGEIDRHLKSMRVATVGFLAHDSYWLRFCAIGVTKRESMVSPMAVSLTAGAAALWVGFTANRDAQARLDRIKRAFAANGRRAAIAPRSPDGQPGGSRSARGHGRRGGRRIDLGREPPQSPGVSWPSPE